MLQGPRERYQSSRIDTPPIVRCPTAAISERCELSKNTPPISNRVYIRMHASSSAIAAVCRHQIACLSHGHARLTQQPLPTPRRSGLRSRYPDAHSRCTFCGTLNGRHNNTHVANFWFSPTATWAKPATVPDMMSFIGLPPSPPPPMIPKVYVKKKA